jgi:uncharacterized DUF497 family protein
MKDTIVYWDDNNLEHIAKHGVDPNEAEYVLRHARRPYPRHISNAKLMVRGRTRAGRALNVIFVFRSPETVDVTKLSFADRVALECAEAVVYIIHARDLRSGEK